jgi:hypothetical protein
MDEMDPLPRLDYDVPRGWSLLGPAWLDLSSIAGMLDDPLDEIEAELRAQRPDLAEDVVSRLAGKQLVREVLAAARLLMMSVTRRTNVSAAELIAEPAGWVQQIKAEDDADSEVLDALDRELDEGGSSPAT